MTDNGNTFTDETLRAYLDGTLPPEEAERVEMALEDDDLARRMMALDETAEDVRSAFAHLPEDERLERLLAAPMPEPAIRGGAPIAANDAAPRSRPWLHIAAATVLGVGIGWIASGLGTTPAIGSDWRMEVAHYQKLYGDETLAAIEIEETELAGQLNRASELVSLDLPTDQLAALDGLELLRTQVLTYEGQPLIQILFKGEAGQAVALCIVETDGRDDAPGFRERLGMGSYEWKGEGHEFVLIGEMDETTTMRHAEAVRGALEV